MSIPEVSFFPEPGSAQFRPSDYGLSTGIDRATHDDPSAKRQSVFGDALDRAVVWSNKPELDRLAGTPVRLRFAVQDANLYSFQFSE